MADLKPCPFCGDTPHLGEMDGWFQVAHDFRHDCPASMEAQDSEELEELWNRRAEPTPEKEASDG